MLPLVSAPCSWDICSAPPPVIFTGWQHHHHLRPIQTFSCHAGWKWWIGQEKCWRKKLFLIFWIARLHWGLEVDCRFGKTGFWWSLMPAEVSANYLLAAPRQLFTPWISTQHVAAIGENILNQVQGTKCKCESVLSSWISINHNHALNIIIEKTVNSCVRVWNAEFSITHLYKFPDD